MKLIISGSQGSGKGTQARLISEKFGLVHLETGDVFRAEIAKGTDLGKKCASYMDRGILLPDSIVFDLLSQLLNEETIKRGFVLDGAPRRLSQIQWLDKQMAAKNSQIDKLILLSLSKEETVKRLSARRICPKCGQNFNLITVPPKNDEICDDCQVKLITREDETPQAIEKRLEAYRSETDPMIDYYRQKNKVIDINGEQSVKKVFQDILNSLSSSKLL